MATSYILPQAAPECADDADSDEAWITAETEALQAAVFADSYGLDWRGAWNLAVALLPEMLSYASDWDIEAAVRRYIAEENSRASA